MYAIACLHLHRHKMPKTHNAVPCPLHFCTMVAKCRIIYESKDNDTGGTSKKAQTAPDKEQGMCIIQVELANHNIVLCLKVSICLACDTPSILAEVMEVD